MARRRFQNGTVYLKGMKNPAWVGRWREDVVIDGKVCRKYRNTVIGYKRDLPTKKLALRELASRLAHVNSPTYRPLRAATFREFSDKWKREILTTMKPSTQLAISSQLRNSLGYFASCKLADIGLSTLQTYVASLTCSPKTARNLVMTLRSMWNTASKQGYVSHDPFDGLVLPRLVKPEQPFFTDDEMRRIIDAAEEPYKTFYWLAGETGMRAGELCGLQWGDVHEGYVQVRRAVWRGNTDTPKTGGSVRCFAISRALAARLQSLGRKSGVPFVFSVSTGRPWDANLVVKRKLHPLLASLGIQRAGLHAFRHGSETVMDREGTPIKVRMDRLGHRDPRMMVNYSHVVSEDDRAAAEAIAKRIAPLCTTNTKGLQDAHLVGPSIQ